MSEILALQSMKIKTDDDMGIAAASIISCNKSSCGGNCGITI